MMKPEEIIQKLKKMGKDRYVLLFLVGIMCVVIASILETQEKKQSESADGAAADERQATAASQSGRQGAQETMPAADEASVGSASMLFYSEYFETHLEDMLSKMEGVGKVCVVVTLQSSEELILERNNPYNRKTDEQTRDGEQSMTTEIQSDSQVVFYENEQGRDTPIVIRRSAPAVKGIVVLAQGADQPGVSEKITQLLVALFGIDGHKIKVAKYSI